MKTILLLCVAILAVLFLCPTSAGAVDVAVTQEVELPPEFSQFSQKDIIQEVAIRTVAIAPSLSDILLDKGIGCLRASYYPEAISKDWRTFRVVVFCKRWPQGHPFSPQRAVRDSAQDTRKK